MTGKITVLIADDSAQTRQSIKAMLSLESGLEVVGEAEDGAEAVLKGKLLKPQVILMDVNMPKMDGITASRQISQDCPGTAVVMISVQGEGEYLRRAMKSGARDYLVKPFTVDELVGAIRGAHRTVDMDAVYGKAPAPPKAQGKVVTVFSTKGGVGKTTVAVNLASAAALKTSQKVALVDLDLEFGCVASMFGHKPTHTIVDLCHFDGELNIDLAERVLINSGNGVWFLAGPLSPEQAAEVDGEGRKVKDRDYVSEILHLLKANYDYVVIDTGCNFRETNLTALDLSDQILLIAAPDIPTLHNTAKCLDILTSRLHYSQDKVRLVLNRADGTMGLSKEDISRSLDYPISYLIPSDGPTAVWGANSGQPFVLRKGKTPIATALLAMAESLNLGTLPGAQSRDSAKKGFFSFGLSS